MISLRPLESDDVDALNGLVVRNREFLAPFEPARDEEFYTARFRAGEVARLLAAADAGTTLPFVILLDGTLVGRITLNNVVRGALQSAAVGYWVDQAANGRGVASAAVAEVARIAFGELDLHRLEAGTLLHNHASQRVLAKNGFVQYGVAPRYLRLAGQWQDHVLFQRLADD